MAQGYAFRCDCCQTVQFVDRYAAEDRGPVGWLKIMRGGVDRSMQTYEVCSTGCAHKLIDRLADNANAS